MKEITLGIPYLKPFTAAARAGLWLLAVVAVALIPALTVLAISQHETAYSATYTTENPSTTALTVELGDQSSQPDFIPGRQGEFYSQ